MARQGVLTYDPALIERVLELYDDGKSKSQIAKELNVHRDTLYAWMKKYPEFARAVEQGEFRAEAWWTELGRRGAMTKGMVEPSLWIFTMKNRFGWRDAKDMTVTASVTTRAVTELTDAELIAIAASGRAGTAVPEGGEGQPH